MATETATLLATPRGRGLRKDTLSHSHPEMKENSTLNRSGFTA
jgi:hypothetical protein